MKMDDQDDDMINVRRSDGRNLDTTGIARHVLLDSTKKSKDKDQHEDPHINIRLHRSDGHEKDFKSSLKGAQEVDTGESKVSRSTLVAHPTHVKIIHLSDTLNQLTRSSISQLPAADILVHTGNFTENGTDEEFSQFNELLEGCKKRFRYFVILPGVNELKKFNIDVIRSKLVSATYVLHNSSCEVFHINIYGLYVGKAVKGEVVLPVGASKMDILLSNTAAIGRLDVVNITHTSDAKSKVHGGDASILEFIQRYQPSLHLHGSFYISRGYLDRWANCPLTVNSCMHGKTGKLINGPYVIEANAVASSKWDFEIGSIY